MASTGRPRVVVVGAGFAGIAAAHELASAPVETVVVDQHNFHTFSPLLYQVATAILEPAEMAQPIRSVLRRAPNATFRLGRVESIDLDGRVVRTEHGPIPYDYLVLAAGSVNHYFNHPAIARNSFGLNDLSEALALRNHLLARCEQAVWTEDPEERRALMTFVIVGGGPTGVEFAGSLSELLYGVLHRDFPDLDMDVARILLVEASEAPLPPFAPRLQRATLEALRRRRVEVRHGHVEEVSDGRVRLDDGEQVAAGTVVWAAGVRAHELAETLGVTLGSQHRIPVGPALQLEGRPEVYVVGDVAEIRQDGKPLPMLAQVALQSGRHAGRAIGAALRGRDAEPFRYRNLGIMATVGRFEAVAQIGRVTMRGSVGWLAWVLVHIARTAGVRARLSVVLDWISGYLVMDRPVRLILRARDPQLPTEWVRDDS